MNAKLSAKKVIAKRDRNRVLKALAYVAAFPLFILFIYLGSISFMEGPAFAATKYYGVIVGAALWLVVSLFQIFALIVTKNSTARAAIVIILTAVIMVGGSVYFDIWAEKKVNEARESYVREAYGIDEETEVDLSEYSIPIANYNSQINNYIVWTKRSSLTDDFNAEVRDLLRVYNIGYTSSVKGSVNTDGSAYGDAPEFAEDEEGEPIPEYWFGETGAVYKANGLYADGYIFSLPVALNILETYYETQAAYKAQKKDADDELDAALEKASKSTEWKSYKNSDEYKAAYGASGTANSYMLTEARLEKIVRTVGKWAVDEGILDMVSGIGLGGTLENMGITESALRNASLDSILTLVNGIAGTSFVASDIVDLLEPFSNYEVSDVKPLMYFIEDEEMRTYAYAKYFGEVHGANVGSKLIPNKTKTTKTTKVVETKSAEEWAKLSSSDKKKLEYIVLKDGSVDVITEKTTTTVTYGNIGCITMDNPGYNAEENAPTLDEVRLMQAKLSYVPTLYPLFAARRYAYVFAGIIAMMLAIFYYAEMKVKLIGRKLEKMSTLGGAR